MTIRGRQRQKYVAMYWRHDFNRILSENRASKGRRDLERAREERRKDELTDSFIVMLVNKTRTKPNLPTIQRGSALGDF